ncbi:hypothetical protein LPJ75_003891, partial [Coemansia sp. RSA 2598]
MLLHPMDPPPWCDSSMKLTLPNVHSFQLPDPSWEWVSPRWLIDMTLDVDEDGWQYASKFSNASWHGRHSAAKSFVRRRRWLRLRRRYRPELLCTGDADAQARDDRVGEECYNEGLEIPENRRRKRSKPVAVASKIKNTVSGNYVGSTPKSTTKASAKNLIAYTLKDGKYRSHNLKGTAKAGAGPGAEAVPQPVSMPPSPVQRRHPREGDGDDGDDGDDDDDDDDGSYNNDKEEEKSVAFRQEQQGMLAASSSDEAGRKKSGPSSPGSSGSGSRKRDGSGTHTASSGLPPALPHYQPPTHSAVNLLQHRLAENWQGRELSARSSVQTQTR